MHSHNDVFTWSFNSQAALRRGNYKIVGDSINDSVIVERQWSLFDLERDPAEKQDLSDDYPELVNELVEEWKALMREME